MRYRAYSFLLLLTCFQPVFAQKIGEPVDVNLLGTSTPLTLEFSDRDYMLIVYSLNADEPPDLKDNPEYGFSVFSVSSGANSATVRNPGASLAAHSGGRLEIQLRRQEQDLARRVQQTGGYRAMAAKVAPHLVGAKRHARIHDAFWADTTSGARRFPHPEELLVSPETSPAIGSVQPLSAGRIQPHCRKGRRRNGPDPRGFLRRNPTPRAHAG